MNKLALVLIVLLTPLVSFCQLIIKNPSSEDVYVAVHLYKNGEWITTGWYRVEPLQNESIITKINNRYFYIYAKSNSLEWSGNDVSAWVHNSDAFETSDDLDYSGNAKYKKVGFRMIDFGSNSKYEFTLDTRSNFLINLEKSFSSRKLDPMEGFYLVSDIISAVDEDGFKSINENWGKVAIIKDTVSLSRNYYELVIKANDFTEGELRAEYIQTKQSTNLFVSDQKNGYNTPGKIFGMEYKPEEGIIEGSFEFTKGGKRYTLKRTYLKYYPK